VGVQASLSVSVGSQIGDEVEVRVEEAHPRDDFLELKEVIWGIQRDSFGWKLSSKNHFFPCTGFVLLALTPKLVFADILGEREFTCRSFLGLFQDEYNLCNLLKCWDILSDSRTSLFKKNVHKHHHLRKWLPVLHSMTSIRLIQIAVSMLNHVPETTNLMDQEIASRHCSACLTWLMAYVV
jgi:hypothetical protein